MGRQDQVKCPHCRTWVNNWELDNHIKVKHPEKAR